MHAKLHVHKTVTAGVNLQCLIYNLLIVIIFSLHILLLLNLTLKNISQGYAQHDGFSHFN